MGVFPFFVGCGRSGTTLLRAIFDSHPAMAVPHESHFVPALARRASAFEAPEGFNAARFAAELAAHPWFRHWELTEPEVAEAVAGAAPAEVADAVRAVYGLYARRRGKTRYGDKTPNYVLELPLLAALFPEARFVHVIRDGRDVALSYAEARFGPGNVYEAARHWRRHVEAGREAGLRLGLGRYREVSYEALVDDPTATVLDLCEFVELGFEPSVLRYFERAEDLVHTLGRRHRERHRHLFLPPTKGLRDWRSQMSHHDAAVFELTAGDLLARLGYPLSGRRPGARARLRVAGHRVASAAREARRAATAAEVSLPATGGHQARGTRP